ncbi:MAG: hypothetical protein K1X90_12670 [Candidatus Kapabacteria bacterium]|nr:hypothetical protein [Candidatus Kapabacteria bacterium]
MLKRRLIWFLTLLFTIVPLITAAQEGTSVPRQSSPAPTKKFSQKRKKHKSYRKKSKKKSRKKSKKKSRKKLHRKRHATNKQKQHRTPRRPAPKPKQQIEAAKPAAPETAAPAASASASRSRREPKVSPKFVVPPATGWRANVRRTVATTPAGTIAPFEAFATLGALLRTLPDQGEVRVRYGIYPGDRKNTQAKRFDQERRNVTVTCWLHGIRYDSASPDENDREVQLLVGTTADTATATMIFARIPGPLWGVGAALQDEFTIAREQLSDAVGTRPTPEWRWITPRQVVVEGGMFFNGLRDPGIRNDAQRDPARPLTVWEIAPVVSVTPISLAE